MENIRILIIITACSLFSKYLNNAYEIQLVYKYIPDTYSIAPYNKHLVVVPTIQCVMCETIVELLTY